MGGPSGSQSMTRLRGVKQMEEVIRNQDPQLGTDDFFFFRSMTAAYVDTQPHLLDKWSSLNPLGRLGRPDELRGVIAWLASDASTFCTGSE